MKKKRLFLLLIGLLVACAPVVGETAVAPTPLPADAAQQAAAATSAFLQALIDDSSGTSSLAYLSQTLQAEVESGNPLTTLLGLQQPFRSFGVETIPFPGDEGQMFVKAGLNEVSPLTRDFVLIEEGGHWLINTIINYDLPTMALPADRIESAQVILDYTQAMAEKRLDDTLFAPSVAASVIEQQRTAAANLGDISAASITLVEAATDEEVYSGTLWAMLADAEAPGEWVSGSNTRWFDLMRTPDGWRINAISTEPLHVTTAVSPTAVPTTAVCTATATNDVPLYFRPDVAAGQFGTLAAGEQVQLSGQMASGWLGFDPAVAQAANVGIFRLRWFPPNSDVTLTGDCAALPFYPSISATACYEMAMGDVPIYALPDETAAILATLPSGSYTALTSRTAAGWYQADLGDGSLAADHPGETGWLAPAAANMNGQSCGELPLATP